MGSEMCIRDRSSTLKHCAFAALKFLNSFAICWRACPWLAAVPSLPAMEETIQAETIPEIQAEPMPEIRDGGDDRPGQAEPMPEIRQNGHDDRGWAVLDCLWSGPGCKIVKMKLSNGKPLELVLEESVPLRVYVNPVLTGYDKWRAATRKWEQSGGETEGEHDRGAIKTWASVEKSAAAPLGGASPPLGGESTP